MLPSINEKYLLKFISNADTDSNLIEMITQLGLKPHCQEYNPVCQIIDELTYCDIFKKKVLK